MFRKKYLSKILSTIIFLVAIYSIQPYTISQVGNTTVWWVINYLILIYLFIAKKYFFDRLSQRNIKFISWYLLWNFISIFRGILVSEIYWDWKGLAYNSMALFLPVVAFSANNVLFLQQLFRSYIKWTLPFFACIIFLIVPDTYGFYLAPLSILLLLLPVIPKYWKYLILILVGLVLFSDLGARSNVIKFAVPLFLLSLYFLKLIYFLRLIEFMRKLLFIAPIVLFLLGALGIFNIFRIQDHVSGEFEIQNKDVSGELKTDNLIADTRTFIYVEVLQTVKKYNSWLIGRSPARGNETEAFYDADVTGRGERLRNEVSILNVLTWTGIVGVLLYFFIFYKASYLAVKYSNNNYSKMFGLFLAFRWMYAWVEDINDFSLSYMFLWVLVGICFSEHFRSMTDDEVKLWVQGIFKKQYQMKQFDIVSKINLKDAV